MDKHKVKVIFSHSITLTVFSGILLALSFPKFNLFLLAWIALVPFLFAIQKSKNPFKLGYFLGITFFSINLAWLTALFDYVGWWAILGYLLLVLFQAFFFGMAGLFIKIFYETAPSFIYLMIPTSWVAFEWIRTLPSTINLGGILNPFLMMLNMGMQSVELENTLSLFKQTTLPWVEFLSPFGVAAGGLGYSQTHFLPFIQSAAVFSIYGVSFIIVFINSALANLPKKLIITISPKAKRNKIIKNITFLLVFMILFYYYGIQELKKPVPAGKNKTTISVIQGNIDQKTKLNPSSAYPSFLNYLKLSCQTKKNVPDIIIWPETAVTSYLLENPYLLRQVEDLAIRAQAYLLIGTPTRGETEKIFNSLIVFDPDGNEIGRYSKEHLVPFGEYLPWRKFLYTYLKSIHYFGQDFEAMPNPNIIWANKIPIGALICFESTLPYLSVSRVEKGAKLLLTVTNDAWFKNSSALEQHLQMGIMRAVENRKYFIQAANTGISAVIDPYGRVLKRTKINETAILTFQVPLP